MDGDTTRLDALEERMGGLEDRLAHLEVGTGDARATGRSPDFNRIYGISTASTSRPVHAPLVPPPAPTTHAPVIRPVPPVAAPQPQWGIAATAGAAPRPMTPEPAQRPQWGSAATAAPTPQPTISLKDLEERFAGRALAWIGGVALVAAAVFFLSLAFSRGWITEPMRVVIGLSVGIAAFAGGAAFLARRNPLLGNVLAGVGLGIFSVAVMAGTRLYHLVPPEIGLALALVAAIAAAVVAVRFDARSTAVFGLVAALIAPPITGADPNVLTLLFVAVTLVGTTGVALYRSWRWLPSIAFILAAPQLASWVGGDPVPAQALVALAGFWLVNIVAAGGEEVRIRRDDLRPSSSMLVLANATFLLWGLGAVLDGDLERWRGLALGLASLAHLAMGAWFLARQGWQHLFGTLVAGTGVALLAIATFVQLGAPAVPIAWAAEAVALAWLAVRRQHRWSALAALVLGTLTLVHLVVLEYPLERFGLPVAIPFSPPLLHPGAASLGGVLAAIVVALALVPVAWIRSALAGLFVLLVAYAAPFEVQGPTLALVLVLAALAGVAADRILERSRTPEELVRLEDAIPDGSFASIAACIAGVLVLVFLTSAEFPRELIGVPVAVPFLNLAWLSLLIVLAGLVGAGLLLSVRWVRSGLAAIGVLLVAYALAFQVTGIALVALLAVLLPVAVVLDRGLARLADGRRPGALARIDVPAFAATAAGVVPWLAAAVYAASPFITPTNWGSVTPPPVPFTDERALVGALLAGSALASARWLAQVQARRLAYLVAVLCVAWVVPFEVYADGVVILWVALAALALLPLRVDPRGARAYAGVASVLWLGGLAVAMLIVARPDRLWVTDPAVAYRDPLAGLWPVAFAALAASVVLAGRLRVFARARAWLVASGGLIALYGVSVAVVDVFARQSGGAVAVEELAKQAQVALSVTWTAIGAVLLALGLGRHRPMLRHAGFALLALATAKVVVIDLAAMDVAYRALVLFGLGLLLLASAWLFTRFRGPRAGSSGLTGGPRPA